MSRILPQVPGYKPETHGSLQFNWYGCAPNLTQHAWQYTFVSVGGVSMAGELGALCGLSNLGAPDKWWALDKDGKPRHGECPKCRAAVERAKAAWDARAREA